MDHTTIKEVSVYRNGAYITRKGQFELKQGTQNVLIEGLTPTLDPATLTLSLNDKVEGSNIRVERYSIEQQNALKKDLLDQITKLQNKIAIRNDQIEILKKNTDFSNRENISLKEMDDYIRTLPEKIETLYNEIAALQEEEKDLQKKLQEKDKEVHSYIVKADLKAKEDGTYPFMLRYYERNASWSPSYEVHAAKDEKVTVILKADISQGSRENWKGVKVNLFTGDPSFSADIPELYPQELSFYQPPVYGSFNGMAMNARVSMKAAMPQEAEEDTCCMEAQETLEEVRYDSASVSQNETMMAYELEGLYDIDNRNPLSIQLTSHAVDCSYHVVAVPKALPYGFLAARVKTQDIRELLDTYANIYYDGTFLGNVYLSPDQSKEDYDISLGKDEGIRLKRTQKKKYRSNVLLKGQTKTEFEYEIEITSLKAKSTKVLLKDQIPVSQDKSIIIETDTLSQGKLNKETGEVSWDIELAPNEKKLITIAYSVSWPKDKQLSL